MQYDMQTNRRSAPMARERPRKDFTMNTPEENISEENTNGADDTAAESNGTGSNGAENADPANADAAEDHTDEKVRTDRRPLGFWLRVVDARLTREFHALFEADGIDRRDWMLLNAIAGTVDRGPVAARLERGGRRLRALVDRGWVTGTPGSWALTAEGRLAFERLGARVSEFRARVAGAVSPEDFATTLATLEAIAAELGGSDDDFGPDRRRGYGRGRGFGPGFGFGWGPGRGFGHGFGPGRRFEGDAPGHQDPEHQHPHHGHHHPHHEHHGHGCHHGGPEFADHGRPESGHRHGHGPGFEGAKPSAPTTEV
jgi:hypothetical protein